ncbi:major facilitator superfamily domain-containing protein [Immersiella caudata]|uniref:Major facilitator superfamily domain-containing protein n=1 Tax=Immersiella caudata TaxID=314043 RepID=A0AA40CA91_9PEZI|nr:major facilitator superfamily domain-containing protein [Immersiella caudata]
MSNDDLSRARRESESANAGSSRADESAPLLEHDGATGQSYATMSPAKVPHLPSLDDAWKPSPGFWWIETALWANVFLSGFDGTITASSYAAISSSFDAANNASWLTTSYLITSTAFQPLYGRFSDLFGRRVCFFVSTVTFMLGCLGCAAARSMTELNLMRALSGFGGGGLITMGETPLHHILDRTTILTAAATVINSDMMPFSERGLYQAIQNVLYGLGSVLGASLGGMIVDSVGWRWCFLSQVPVSIFALVVGYYVLAAPERSPEHSLRTALGCLDFPGAILLVVGLAVQLLGLSLGGNEYPWSSFPVVASLAGSTVLLMVFVLVEMNTGGRKLPIIPLWMLKGWQPVAVQLTNLFVGMASYAYMFMVPLYLQACRGDSPSATGARLIAPSLATLVGGIVAGTMMQRGCLLRDSVRRGTALMVVGNVLACMMVVVGGSRRAELLYLIPANLGAGLTNPSVLFSFISLFGYQEQAVATSTVYLIRSMGSIYGVTITSAIVQNLLAAGLPAALGPDASDELIEKLRKSVFALQDLPPAIQAAVRALYGDALLVAFAASSAFALLAFVFSWAHRTEAMQRKS